MINIYDNVNAVAADLRETAQYKTLRDAVEALNGNAEAKAVFQRFQQAQMEINQSMQAGKWKASDQTLSQKARIVRQLHCLYISGSFHKA